jgi:putative membrane fusion protein
VIILLVVSAAVYLLVVGNFSNTEQTYNLTYDEINVEDHYKALIIRKEHMLISSGTGTLIQVANDGEKVKRNQRILDITKSENLNAQGLTVTVEDNAEIAKYNIEQLEVEIADLKIEIADLIHEKNYDPIQAIAQELDSKIKRRKMMIEGVMEETYNETEVGSGELEVGESESLETPLSGILTYYVDGYENELTFAEVMQLDLEEVIKLDIEPYVATQGVIRPGDVMAKIIDDDYYYLIILVDQGDQNMYDLSEDLVLEVGSQEISGYITEVIPTSNQVAIVIKVDTYLDGFYKKRFVDVKITQETHNGLVIKSSSIVNTDEGIGVYVMDRYKKVSFKPIKVVVHQDDTVIVKEDVFYQFIDGKNTRIDTVGISDRVLLDGMKYQYDNNLN